MNHIATSYRREGNFGQTFYDIVMELKPQTIVEFGVLQGYSAISMAKALKELGRGTVHAYDIWNTNKHHYSEENTQENIDREGVREFVVLHTGDFNEWIKNPTPFDLLHVDVDNTGDTVKLLAETFPGKHVIFEGGIHDRDVYQGKEHNTPMVGAADFIVINGAFPGLSKLS